MTVTLNILEIGARGDGVAQEEGQRYFVPFTLPGEIVEAEPRDKRGEGIVADLAEILAPSRHREPAPCKHFGTCGGCALQHWRRDIYAGWKNELIVRALEQRGVVAPPFEPALGGLPNERRRADFVVRRQGRRSVAGFHERASQQIVDLAECFVVTPRLVALLPLLRTVLAGILPEGASADAIVNDTDAGLDVLVRPHKRFALSLDANQRLVAFAGTADLARLSWGDRATAEPLVTRRQPRLTFGDVVLEPPPGAFLQATRRAEQAMREAVASWLGEAKRVADLFAGMGTLTVGRPWRATLYESDKPSMAAVEAAGRRLGSGKLTAVHRDLFRNPLMAAELDAFDAVVLDPPRAGAVAQSAELARSKVPRVVYGACDPGSFARDARTLQDGGYRLEKLLPIDQFLWSPHVELIALFVRAPLRSAKK
ncbi:MAG: class I SAM-dependent RNA methyltransferase [Reyranella sp.]|uniref:class I SAM-dependent RNA methyltransferase n=1 Tax=Reyranella sp. TaxID=1929291 RepID=UPI0012154934|nr:RsmD family RNA methyltransferase [Reyranella sp.]TAJ37340.1 MAG: class I SAM-dependent RNA methyltransferase [Reyranella sp.]